MNIHLIYTIRYSTYFYVSKKQLQIYPSYKFHYQRAMIFDYLYSITIVVLISIQFIIYNSNIVMINILHTYSKHCGFQYWTGKAFSSTGHGHLVIF